MKKLLIWFKSLKLLEKITVIIFPLLIFFLIFGTPLMRKYLFLYWLLWARPELFIIAAHQIGKSVIETLITVWSWTTFLTFLTWFLASAGEKGIKIVGQKENWYQRINQWMQRPSQKVIKWAKRSKYLLFLTYAFPILPMLDTFSVVAIKLTRIKYGLFIILLINTVKIIIITGLCFEIFV